MVLWEERRCLTAQLLTFQGRIKGLCYYWCPRYLGHQYSRRLAWKLFSSHIFASAIFQCEEKHDYRI